MNVIIILAVPALPQRPAGVFTKPRTAQAKAFAHVG